jgi:hypothetical protein
MQRYFPPLHFRDGRVDSISCQWIEALPDDIAEFGNSFVDV